MTNVWFPQVPVRLEQFSGSVYLYSIHGSGSSSQGNIHIDPDPAVNAIYWFRSGYGLRILGRDSGLFHIRKVHSFLKIFQDLLSFFYQSRNSFYADENIERRSERFENNENVQVFWLFSSVVDPDPDPKGYEPFCSIRIRIRIIGSDPDPEPKGSKWQFYVVKQEFSCFKSSIWSESTKILTLKLVEKRTLFPKVKFLHSKSFDVERIWYI